jgi:hypothetical protein
LLINLPCYHGVKLPEVGANSKAFWNGKSWSFELAHVRAVYETGEDFGDLRLYPVIRCRHCRKLWRADWSDVIDYIPEPMRAWLAIHARDGMRRELAALTNAQTEAQAAE